MPDSPPPKYPQPPVPINRLKQICNDACFSVFEKVEKYEHSRTEGWNNSIINYILRSLCSESTVAGSSQCPFKFAVNSTIIQHLSSKASSTGTDGAGVGRRGMHSACGAYWNNEKDGTWSFKYEAKGMDVVVSIIWIAL
ncbi:Tctex-1 [Kalaharituber pfeilii]|nr:Tctex-1 [Kalaharituber pfeilii]